MTFRYVPRGDLNKSIPENILVKEQKSKRRIGKHNKKSGVS
jgi:hypothetical protein